jgi:pimeloyl-ACP methyl ester carboxylesterase
VGSTDVVARAFDVLVGGGARRRELDRGGRMLRWVEAGSGTPVVLEAGAMSPIVTFAAVFKELVAEHQVIAYDRAGYGMSDPAPLSLELQIDDLVAVLEAVGPAVVVGHSWGGLLAQLATWARPELVRGLVLLDPSHERYWRDDTPMEHPDRTRPPTADPRYQDLLDSATELADDVTAGLTPQDAEVTRRACLAYLDTDDQWFTCLDELPMILDHVGEFVRRRERSVWPAIPSYC